MGLYGPCKDLPSRLQSLDEEHINSCEVAPEEESILEDVPDDEEYGDVEID